jgi:hypothetical protein
LARLGKHAQKWLSPRRERPLAELSHRRARHARGLYEALHALGFLGENTWQ